MEHIEFSHLQQKKLTLLRLLRTLTDTGKRVFFGSVFVAEFNSSMNTCVWLSPVGLLIFNLGTKG